MFKNMKKEVDKNIKSGISIVALMITVAVLAILIGVTFEIGDETVNNSRKAKFINDISTMEDAVKAYYIENDSLPFKDEKLTLEQTRNLVNTEVLNYFNEEISLNNDSSSEFYKIDLSLINVENVNDFKEENYLFFVAYPSFNVYNIKGQKIGNATYFSLSSRIENYEDIKNEKISTSSIDIVEEEILNVNAVEVSSSKLNIVINADISNNRNLYISLPGINQNEYKVNNNIYLLKFDSLEELNNSLETKISESTISSFKNLPTKNIKVILKDSSNNILSNKEINVSYYMLNKPVVSLQGTYREYDNMKVITVSFEGDNIQNIRYEYADEKVGINVYDIEYMKTKSKSINCENVVNNIVEIKVPINSIAYAVMAIDENGNNSDIIYKDNLTKE